MKSRALACITAATFLIALSLQTAAGQGLPQRSYKVVDLGTLGGACSFAFAINDRGQVGCFSNPPGQTCLAVIPGAVHAFVWQNGVMTDLGTLGGPDSQVTFGLNEILVGVGPGIPQPRTPTLESASCEK